MKITGCPPWVQKGRNGWRLSVWAQPGAKKTQCVGTHGDCLKIRLQAPAVDNKANNALILFVAKILELRPQQVTIDSGQITRKKILTINTQEEPDWTLLSSQEFNKP